MIIIRSYSKKYEAVTRLMSWYCQLLSCQQNVDADGRMNNCVKIRKCRRQIHKMARSMSSITLLSDIER